MPWRVLYRIRSTACVSQLTTHSLETASPLASLWPPPLCTQVLQKREWLIGPWSGGMRQGRWIESWDLQHHFRRNIFPGALEEDPRHSLVTRCVCVCRMCSCSRWPCDKTGLVSPRTIRAECVLWRRHELCVPCYQASTHLALIFVKWCWQGTSLIHSGRADLSSFLKDEHLERCGLQRQMSILPLCLDCLSSLCFWL